VEVGLRRVGQAAKRGIAHRIPRPDALSESIEGWLGSEPRDHVRTMRRAATDDGRWRVEVSLHPSAPNAQLVVDAAGAVEVSAITAFTGPGYHTYVGRLLDRLGEDLSIAWSSAGLDGTSGPLDRPTVERTHLAWLRAQLVRAAEARRTGASAVHLGTPSGVRYRVSGALATPLGPRSDAWVSEALTDPRVAIDVWPWFADATDGRYHLDRARCLLWTEIRWRPAADAAERSAILEAIAHLRRAHVLDPDLPMPWREWLELLALTREPEPLASTIQARAAATDPSLRRIGYRRDPVTIIHGGWTLDIPGAFSERRTDAQWQGGDGGRSIALQPLRPPAGDGRLPADRVLESIAGDLGPEALDHRADGLVGRARMRTDDASGLSVGVVEGYVAVTGRGAGVRVEFDDPAEWQWALDRWRELRPA
jgi:hypothetical protein